MSDEDSEEGASQPAKEEKASQLSASQLSKEEEAFQPSKDDLIDDEVTMELEENREGWKDETTKEISSLHNDAMLSVDEIIAKYYPKMREARKQRKKNEEESFVGETDERTKEEDDNSDDENSDQGTEATCLSLLSELGMKSTSIADKNNDGGSHREEDTKGTRTKDDGKPSRTITTTAVSSCSSSSPQYAVSKPYLMDLRRMF